MAEIGGWWKLYLDAPYEFDGRITKALTRARDEALEEAAKLCDDNYLCSGEYEIPDLGTAIRALKSKGE